MRFPSSRPASHIGGAVSTAATPHTICQEPNCSFKLCVWGGEGGSSREGLTKKSLLREIVRVIQTLSYTKPGPIAHSVADPTVCHWVTAKAMPVTG